MNGLVDRRPAKQEREPPEWRRSWPVGEPPTFKSVFLPQ
jgi:hypothetical protein